MALDKHVSRFRDPETEDVTSRTVSIRKRDLAIVLQGVSPHPNPKVRLEQYTVPADLAAEILFLACYRFGDIQGKRVLDLGTGTGRLALAASMLGARSVVGIDIDGPALEAAARSAERLGLDVDWIHGPITSLRGSVDTVVMNPPFGTKEPHADIQFLQVALGLAETVYSIHKSSTRRFITSWAQKHGGSLERLFTADMEIPHQFTFHRKRRRMVEVDVFRIRRETS